MTQTLVCVERETDTAHTRTDESPVLKQARGHTPRKGVRQERDVSWSCGMEEFGMKGGEEFDRTPITKEGIGRPSAAILKRYGENGPRFLLPASESPQRTV
jgi:hypothetical protein